MMPGAVATQFLARAGTHDPTGVEKLSQGMLWGGTDPDRLEDVRSNPAEDVSLEETVREFRQRMTPDERALAEMRADGKSWTEIGEFCGDSAEALRKRLERAVERAAEEMGIDGP